MKYDSYEIRQVAQEGWLYEDATGRYPFSIVFNRHTYTFKVEIPEYADEQYNVHILTDEEKQRILPRLKAHLSRPIKDEPPYHVKFVAVSYGQRT